MIEPKFKLTHKILSSIVTFEVEKKEIENLPNEDEIRRRMINNANTTEIFHLGQLLGINLTLKLAKKISLGQTMGLDDYRSQYLINYRNALEYILSTQSSYYQVQGDVLLHLNRLLAKNVAEEWDAKFRTGGESIDNKDDNWVQFRDQNLSAANTQMETTAQMEWFNSTTIKVHPLIKIPVVLFNLMRISPFVVANKLTNLSVTKFLFFRSGYLINGYLPIMKSFALHEDEFIDSWKQALESENDLTLWIERFTHSFAEEIVTIRENLKTAQEDYKEKNKQPFLNLNRRQLKILRYLQNIPEIKREEYVEMLDVSTMTAYRDLTELVKKGLLRVEGQGRGTRYILSSR